MLKYKVGDKVKVRTGKDKGREGVIERIFTKKGTALIPGVNLYKKHIKKSIARDGKGGIYELPRPIDLSKLSVIDPKSKKSTRVGFEVKGGHKLRITKKSKSLLDKQTKTKK